MTLPAALLHARWLRVPALLFLVVSALALPAAAQTARTLVLLEDDSPTLGELRSAASDLRARGVRITGLLPPRALIAQLDPETSVALIQDPRVRAASRGTIPLSFAEGEGEPARHALCVWNALQGDQVVAVRAQPNAPELPHFGEGASSFARANAHAATRHAAHWARESERWTTSLLARQGFHVEPPPMPPGALGDVDPGAFGFYDTSLYLSGEIALGVFYVPAGANTWSAAEQVAFNARLLEAGDTLALVEPNAHVSFLYVFEGMTALPDDLRAYANSLRAAVGSDWAIVAQCDKNFAGASALNLGPRTILTPLNNVGVIRHEFCHLFGSLDQYSSGSPAASLAGYLGVSNSNAQRNDGLGFFGGQGEGRVDIMTSPSSVEFRPSTRGQLGWRDSDGDGLLDPRDTHPDTRLDAPASNPLQISGYVVDQALPILHHNELFGSVTLNTVSALEQRVDGGPWLPVSAADGAFDSRDESFSFELPPLTTGKHLLELRATNSVGNVEPSPARRVLQITGGGIALHAPRNGATVTRRASGEVAFSGLAQPPIAAFTLSPERQVGPSTSSVAQHEVQLDGSASFDPEGHALEWRWDLDGDGTWDTPFTASPTLTHALPLAAGPPSFGQHDFGEAALATAITSTHAFVAEFGGDVRVLDTSDPSATQLVNTIPATARDLALSGTRLLVAEGNAGLTLHDLSAPAAPQALGTLSTPGTVFGVTVNGDHAYLADSVAGLLVVDISDPRAPTITGSRDLPGTASGVEYANGHAYVLSDFAGVHVVRVTNPAVPGLASTLASGADVQAVAVDGSLAVVATDAGGAFVYDMSAHANPQLLDVFATQGDALSVALDDDTAYVGTDHSAIELLDMSTPAAPVRVAVADVFGASHPLDLVLDGARLHVANQRGHEIIDLSGTPVNVATNTLHQVRLQVRDTQDGATAETARQAWSLTYDTPPALASVAWRGSETTLVPTIFGQLPTDAIFAMQFVGTLAYLAEGETGLRIVDVSDPAAPSTVSTHATLDSANDVLVAQDIAYLSDLQQGLRLVDVSDPAAPFELGSYVPGGFAFSVEVSGDVAYFGGTFGLVILDVSDPTSPTLLGSEPNVVVPLDMLRVGDLLLCASTSAGLSVVDVSDPTSPVLLSVYPSTEARSVALSGNLVQLASGSQGLLALDISDPTQPALVGTLPTSTPLRRVLVHDGVAYLAGQAGGVLLADVSTPSAPRWLGGTPSEGQVFAVGLSQGALFAGDDVAGLQAYRLRMSQRHRWELTDFVDQDFGTTWDGLLRFRVDMGNDGSWDSAFTPADEVAEALAVIPEGLQDYEVLVELRDRFEGTTQRLLELEINPYACLGGPFAGNLRLPTLPVQPPAPGALGPLVGPTHEGGTTAGPFLPGSPCWRLEVRD
ncbi:MAG: hypothetical protein DHS20C15_12050 [Planctomycetota bacterium]|nr:MAG: hypothetical protein DHS20C15_12050 [Planctomycetota bacterium]